MSEQEKQEQTRPVFDLIRVYSKDSSLETPFSPAIFQATWKPEVQVKFDTNAKKISDDQYEVTLHFTVSCNNDGQTAFNCEVSQGGLFLMRNVPEGAREFLLGGTAPNILFPFVRDFITNLISRASLPPLNLAPINFEALYRAKHNATINQTVDPAEIEKIIAKAKQIYRADHNIADDVNDEDIQYDEQFLEQIANLKKLAETAQAKPADTEQKPANE